MRTAIIAAGLVLVASAAQAQAVSTAVGVEVSRGLGERGPGYYAGAEVAWPRVRVEAEASTADKYDGAGWAASGAGLVAADARGRLLVGYKSYVRTAGAFAKVGGRAVVGTTLAPGLTLTYEREMWQAARSGDGPYSRQSNGVQEVALHVRHGLLDYRTGAYRHAQGYGVRVQVGLRLALRAGS